MKSKVGRHQTNPAVCNRCKNEGGEIYLNHHHDDTAPTMTPALLNVLLIIVDDLRVDPQMLTPHAESLAKRGVSFSRAFAQLSLCSPSRSSLLTGMRPDSTGVYDLVTHWRERLGPHHRSLPHVFKEADYSVLGIGKVFHPSKDGRTLDDPAAWTSPVIACDRLPLFPPAPGLEREASGLRIGHTISERKVPRPAVASLDVDDGYFRDGCIAEAAVRTLRRLCRQNGGSGSGSGAECSSSLPPPFFLAVGFTKPHLPWVVPARYFDRYDRSRLGMAPNHADKQQRTPRSVDGLLFLSSGARL